MTGGVQGHLVASALRAAVRVPSGGRAARASSDAPKLEPMIRWMVVIFLALLLISWFTPLLHKLGFGRLPGDFRFKLFGRDWNIPLATTIVLSLLASTIARFL